MPTSYTALLHAAEHSGRTSLGRVRMCVSAGETLPRHLFLRWRDRFGVEILDGIGSTEILHIFISNQPGRSRAGSTGRDRRPATRRKHRRRGRTGRCRHGRGGNAVDQGRQHRHGLLEQARSQSKGTYSTAKWINTHDKFMVDQDGFFWYSGRTDDMLKVSGQAVWPTEVEAVLQTHPAVLEAGVTGAADDEGLLKPVAFVVLKDGQTPSPELGKQLQDHVKKNTAPHKYPRVVVFVEHLPKTATGKIKRFELRERAASDGLLRSQKH